MGLGLVGALLPQALPAQESNPAEVVAAEHAFAALVREAGVKAGFLEYLAPAGVVFRRGPVNGREWFAGRPGSAGLLAWRPVLAGSSLAGDLAFSTGPFTANTPDGVPAGTGWYLSVWRREPDGKLRLFADHGMAAREPADTSETLRLLPASHPGAAVVSLDVLFTLDKKTSAAPADADVRTHAAGLLSLGPDARLTLLGDVPPVLVPSGGGVASSADLGYTYGAYRWRQEQGYYLRVWRRQHADWLVIADVYSPNR